MDEAKVETDEVKGESKVDKVGLDEAKVESSEARVQATGVPKADLEPTGAQPDEGRPVEAKSDEPIEAVKHSDVQNKVEDALIGVVVSTSGAFDEVVNHEGKGTEVDATLVV